MALPILYTAWTNIAPKSLPTFKLDVTVNYAGHAFQTCHVITSNKCVQLLTK